MSDRRSRFLTGHEQFAESFSDEMSHSPNHFLIGREWCTESFSGSAWVDELVIFPFQACVVDEIHLYYIEGTDERFRFGMISAAIFRFWSLCTGIRNSWLHLYRQQLFLITWAYAYTTYFRSTVFCRRLHFRRSAMCRRRYFSDRVFSALSFLIAYDGAHRWLIAQYD